MSLYKCPDCGSDDFRVLISVTAEMNGEGQCFQLEGSEPTLLDEHGVLCAECGGEFTFANLRKAA